MRVKKGPGGCYFCSSFYYFPGVLEKRLAWASRKMVRFVFGQRFSKVMFNTEVICQLSGWFFMIARNDKNIQVALPQLLDDLSRFGTNGGVQLNGANQFSPHP